MESSSPDQQTLYHGRVIPVAQHSDAARFVLEQPIGQSPRLPADLLNSSSLLSLVPCHLSGWSFSNRPQALAVCSSLITRWSPRVSDYKLRPCPSSALRPVVSPHCPQGQVQPPEHGNPDSWGSASSLPPSSCREAAAPLLLESPPSPAPSRLLHERRQ